MSRQIDLFERVVRSLESLGIPYMTVGSMASGVHGLARSTQDVDVVIEPSREQLQAFVDSFAAGYYVSRSGAFQALEQRGMFNIIEQATGEKVDLIMTKEDSFGREASARKRKGSVSGVEAWVISPEDCMLSKLEWCKGRDYDNQQFRDVAGIVAVQKERLDLAYLRKWAKELGVEEALEAVLKAAAG